MITEYEIQYLFDEFYPHINCDELDDQQKLNYINLFSKIYLNNKTNHCEQYNNPAKILCSLVYDIGPVSYKLCDEHMTQFWDFLSGKCSGANYFSTFTCRPI